MIRSIRQFLLVSLLISITIASSITAIVNYLLDKQVIQPYQDEQLVKISAFIEILRKTAKQNPFIQKKIAQFLYQSKSDIARHLLFQVWGADGKLLMQSTDVPPKLLTDAPPGFSDNEINEDDW